MTTGNIKFSQLPDLPAANITAATIAPVVENNINYKVTLANLTSYINNSGNITATSVSASGNITAGNFIGDGSLLTNIPATPLSGTAVGDIDMDAYALRTGLITSTTSSSPTGLDLNINTDYVGFGGGAGGAVYLGTTSGPTAEAQANILVGGISLIKANTTGVYVNATTSVTGDVNATGVYYGDGSGLSNVSASLPSTITVAGNIVGGNLETAGNVTGAFFLGNGSQLTGLPATYSNANVATYLASGNVTSNIITTGNIGGGNASVTGNIQMSGRQLLLGPESTADTYITTANIGRLIFNTNEGVNSGTIIIEAGSGGDITIDPNGVGNIVANANVSVTGMVSATGNIQGSFFLGNGSQLTGLPATYSNAQVSAYLASGTNSANIVTTGNVSGTYIIGSGAALTSLPGANVTGTVANAAYATNAGTASSATTAITATSATTATTAGTVTSASQPTITSVGTLTSLSVSGNVTGNYFIGNGSQLTGIVATSSYGNANVATFLANYGSNTITTTGNVSLGNIVTNNANLSGWLKSNAFVTAPSVTASSFLQVGDFSGTRGTLIFAPDTKANILATTGGAGQVVCVSDSPTYACRLAYWTTTAPQRWRYVDDNTAVT